MKSLANVYKVIRELDPSVEPDSQYFQTAVLLLSLFVMGPDAERLSIFCKRSIKEVREKLARLRENGIVADDEAIVVDWEDEDTGGIAFWMDCAVADGHLLRNKDHSYKITEDGKEYVARGFKL